MQSKAVEKAKSTRRDTAQRPITPDFHKIDSYCQFGSRGRFGGGFAGIREEWGCRQAAEEAGAQWERCLRGAG